MHDPSTDELRKALEEAPSIDSYLNENEQAFNNTEVSSFISGRIAEEKIPKAELARKAGMSEIYLHQILNGKRNPSRNRLICICLALGASLDETQELLKKCSYACLYPRSRRDSILMYAFLHQQNVGDVNSQLFTAGEDTLF